jgi:N-formylglutamate deformylase
MVMNPVSVKRGKGIVILGQPHGGTYVPPEIKKRLNDTGLQLADTDWHIGQLYDGLLEDATVVSANFHRYVIDANRDPTGTSLYPGQNTTGLCPLTDFDGELIYRRGREPTKDDVAARVGEWHAPYHTALLGEIERVKKKYGIAIVYDCHSIRSRIPFLFDGQLPTLNVGTDNGATCDKRITEKTYALANSSPFTCALDGRFRGGWTTRRYGQPDIGLHAIQMEITQQSYLRLEEPPWRYDDAAANHVRRWLGFILNAVNETALDMAAQVQS